MVAESQNLEGNRVTEVANRPPSRLGRGFQSQMNVIGALLMREIHTRYGRDNIGYLWMFLEPMLLAIAISLLHAGQKSHYGTDIQPVPFTILGYSFFIMFRGMVTRAEGALESNMPLLYHRSVTLFDMMSARALLEGAGTFVTYVSLLGFAIMIGFADIPARMDQLLIGAFLMASFSFSLSLVIAGWTHDNHVAGRLVHPICYVLMPLSGCFFQQEWLVEPYRSLIGWIPMVPIFEQLRYGQFESAKNTYCDLSYVLAWIGIMTYGGMIILIKTRRRVHLH